MKARPSDIGAEQEMPPATISSMREGSSTWLGPERSDPAGIKPTLGSFSRIVGPAADIRELEYISSLHQNAEKFLRLDGTICSKDIAPYLSSRYGMEITPEQAVDIAVNLCGGKLRGNLSAEKDAQHALEAETRKALDEDGLPQIPMLDHDDDKGEEENSVYYFDLVQLMSLLLIPELVLLSDNQDNIEKCSDVDDSKTFRLEVGELFELVIKSLTEIFDDRTQQDIINGRRTLDKELLSAMLEANGDVDAANDDALLIKMLNTLGSEDSPLTTETLMKAVTTDVRNYYSNINDKPEEGGPDYTSLFYDIFGRNWEEGEKQGDAKMMGEAPLPTDTASFIDYSADTHGSVFLNTMVWSLFLLSTLIYLNFFLTLLDDGSGGYLCPDSGTFSCNVLNKIFVWVLTAIFCGTYGALFVVPTSIGNVAGKTPRLYFTLFMTAIYTYAPFSTLIWYRGGAPHNAETEIEYRVVCPAWLGANLSTIKNVQSLIQESENGAQYYARLDSTCHRAVQWCEVHPEIQGRYIDRSPSFLTYDEFEKCYSFFGGSKLAGRLWTLTGGKCDLFNASCPDRGACGLRSLANTNDTLFEEDYICCHSGHAVSFYSTRYQDAGHDVSNDRMRNIVCDDQPIGQRCTSNIMCEDGAVCDNNTCAIPSEKNESGWLGSPCDREHALCKSGYCWNGTCQQHPNVCPMGWTKPFAGFRIDPFCRTFDDWCRYTDLFQFEGAFKEYFGITLVSRFICNQVLNLTQRHGLVRVLNESDSEIGYSYVHENYNLVEETLLQDWAYLVLLSIAIVGFFAVLAILRKLMMQNGDNRLRDHKIKYAAASKVNRLIENAAELHTHGVRGKGRAMRNYFLRGERKIEIGGLSWTLKNLWSGHLSRHEGVRYPGRIWVGQVAQVVVTVIGVLFALAFIRDTGNRLDKERGELGSSYTQQDVEGISNVDWATVTLDDLYVTAEEQAALERIPERWMFDAAAFPGAMAGFLAAVFCILVYIPSTTNTILKLRNGQLPSLHDPFFGIYRRLPDNVVQNIGNMFFSLVGASALLSLIVFLLIFVFTYNVTRVYAIGVLASLTGMACTMGIKTVGQTMLRARHFSSFYRKKPKSANYQSLMFECWALGTAALVAATRLGMFLLSGALWLGRVDVEFLHPNVKVVGVALDSSPIAFKRDLLAHEAHLHPYIERLGAMYLLRLRDGDGFGSVAGTTWRCLFVCGLMPWIVKHRVNTNEEATLERMADKGRPKSLMNINRARVLGSTTRTSGLQGYLPSEEGFLSSRGSGMMMDDSVHSFYSV